MERVIVTGGAGFIGSHIVEELLRNQFHVIVIDDFSTGRKGNIENLSIDLHHYDITDPGIIDLIVSLCPNYIIHQAAQVSVAQSIQDPLFDENVNIKGSLHMIQAAAKANVKKFVFASSAAVYGNPMVLPISTHHPTLPESPYGLTKLTVESYLKMTEKLYHLPFSILRYSNVYGPKQDAKGEGGVISIFFDRLINNETPIIFGDGEQTRDFIFVKDVAVANVKALMVKDNIQVNVSSGVGTSINQLFQLVKEVAGSDIEAIYQMERPGDIRYSILSNLDTKSKLDWEPSYELYLGLQETLRYSARV